MNVKVIEQKTLACSATHSRLGLPMLDHSCTGLLVPWRLNLYEYFPKELFSNRSPSMITGEMQMETTSCLLDKTTIAGRGG